MPTSQQIQDKLKQGFQTLGKGKDAVKQWASNEPTIGNYWDAAKQYFQTGRLDSSDPVIPEVRAPQPKRKEFKSGLDKFNYMVPEVGALVRGEPNNIMPEKVRTKIESFMPGTFDTLKSNVTGKHKQGITDYYNRYLDPKSPDYLDENVMTDVRTFRDMTDKAKEINLDNVTPLRISSQLENIQSGKMKFQQADPAVQLLLRNTPGVRFINGVPKYDHKTYLNVLTKIPAFRDNLQEAGNTLGQGTAMRAIGGASPVALPAYILGKAGAQTAEGMKDPMTFSDAVNTRRAAPATTPHTDAPYANFANKINRVYDLTLGNIPANVIAKAEDMMEDPNNPDVLIDSKGNRIQRQGRTKFKDPVFGKEYEFSNPFDFSGNVGYEKQRLGALYDLAKATPAAAGKVLGDYTGITGAPQLTSGIKQNLLDNFRELYVKYPEAMKKKYPEEYAMMVNQIKTNRQNNPSRFLAMSDNLPLPGEEYDPRAFLPKGPQATPEMQKLIAAENAEYIKRHNQKAQYASADEMMADRDRKMAGWQKYHESMGGTGQVTMQQITAYNDALKNKNMIAKQ